MRVAKLSLEYADLLNPPPAQVMDAIGMLSPNERAVLHNLARENYRGDGLIIDAGLFLGASTIAFASGLRSNPRCASAVARLGKPIRSYELGLVNPGMLRIFAKHGIGEGLKIDDSFEPLLRKEISGQLDLVDLYIGDILRTGQVDQPIEILFIDLLKLPSIADFVVHEYFTRLIPGVSIIIQQDYFIDKLPFIKTMQETFADYFSFVGAVGPSALYKLERIIPTTAIDRYFASHPTLEEELHCADIALGRAASVGRRFLMELSRLHVMRRHRSGRQALSKSLDAVRAKYPDFATPAADLRMRNALADIERTLVAKKLTKEQRRQLRAERGLDELANRSRERSRKVEARAARSAELAERKSSRDAAKRARATEVAAIKAERERRKAVRAAEIVAVKSERERKKAEQRRERSAAAGFGEKSST